MGESVDATGAKIAQDAALSHRWIFFVTGPTACGKTTVAKYIAEKLNLTFLEGDDYHPKANVEKMSRGEGLTDADRADWLEALRDHESIQTPPDKPPHLVMTCSALKRKYRDVLREGSQKARGLQVRFVFLDAPEQVLVERAQKRKGHYAGANLVHSQFADLEMPGEDEKDVVTIDVNRPMEETEKDILDRIEAMLNREGRSTEGLCAKQGD